MNYKNPSQTAHRVHIEPLESRVFLTVAPGGIDTTFANAGRLVIAGVGPESFRSAGAAVGPDGKEVIAGWRNRVESSQLIAVRLNADGTIDGTFGQSGIVQLEPGLTGDSMSHLSIAVQTDEKVLIAGAPTGQQRNFNGDVAVLRLNTNGTPDNSFGNAGIAIIPKFEVSPFVQTDHALGRIVVRGDGKIMLSSGGAQLDPSFQFATDFGFARLLPNGSLDSTYHHGGVFHSDLTTGGLSVIYSAEAQADGSILVCGTKGDHARIAVERYTPDGYFDSTFAQNGRILSTLSEKTYLNPVANLSPDGNIVISTWTDKSSGNTFQALVTLARFGPDGRLDTSFGVTGLSKIPFSNFAGDPTTDSAPVPRFQGSGILLGERTSNGVKVVRITHSGTLDATFGSAGQFTTLGGTLDYDNDPLQIAIDNRIYVVGDDLQIYRHTVNGNPDTTYGSNHDGLAKIPFVGPVDDTLGAAAVLPDGRFVLLGSNSPATGIQDYNPYIRRFMPDASPDLSLSPNATFSPEPYFSFTTPAQMLADSNGRILVSDSVFASYIGNTYARTRRYTESGVPDSSYVGNQRNTPINFTSLDLALKPDNTIVTLTYSTRALSLRVTKYKLAVLSTDGRTLHVRTLSGDGSDNAHVTSTPDNKIILAGPFAKTPGQLQLRRYDQNLTLDKTFGTNGTLTPDLPSNFRLKSLATQPDGKILLAGRSGYQLVLYRFNANGKPDRSFGIGGHVGTSFVGPPAETPILRNLIIQPTGQIILGGYTNSAPNSDSDLLLIRYTPTGQPDPTFGTNGIIKSNLGGHDVLTSIALTPDNKLLAFGTTTYLGNGITTPNDSDIVVTRYDL